MPRNIRHNYSTHAAGRAVQSTFRRGEVIPKFTANFAEALATGEYLTAATWYCGNYQSVVMSNAVSDSTTASIKIYCQYPCGSWLKCVVTTSTGASHALIIAVNVLQGYWFTGDPTVTTSGPQTLTSTSLPPAGTITLIANPPSGITGIAYSYQLTATGGSGTYNYSLSSGTLPAGLSLAPLTGLITGTPTTVQTTSPVFRVDDTAGHFALTPATIAISQGQVGVGSLLHFDAFNLPNTVPGQGTFPTTADVYGSSWGNYGVTLNTANYRFGPGSAQTQAGNNLRALRSTGAPFNYATSDFTIEYWIYNSFGNLGYEEFMVDQRSTGLVGLHISWDTSTRALKFGVNGVNRITGATVGLNAFIHIAYCRASSVGRLFLNGVQQVGDYADTNNYTSSDITLMNQYLAATQQTMEASMDEFCVTRSAKYLTNFTPPTSPLT